MDNPITTLLQVADLASNLSSLREFSDDGMLFVNIKGQGLKCFESRGVVVIDSGEKYTTFSRTLGGEIYCDGEPCGQFTESFVRRNARAPE